MTRTAWVSEQFISNKGVVLYLGVPCQGTRNKERGTVAGVLFHLYCLDYFYVGGLQRNWLLSGFINNKESRTTMKPSLDNGCLQYFTAEWEPAFLRQARVPIFSFATQGGKQASSYFRQRNWVQAGEAQIRFPAGCLEFDSIE